MGLENQYNGLHTPGNYKVRGPSTYICAECREPFEQRYKLDYHASEQRHQPFGCSCGKTFSRIDSLTRHCASFCKGGNLFPCKYCKAYRGNHSFTRRDHLVQHLGGYHKFSPEEIEEVCPKTRQAISWKVLRQRCPYPECDSLRDEASRGLRAPFPKQSDYSAHLRDVHKVTPFPCPVSGCERVGAKGYVAGSGLIGYLSQVHPADPQALLKFRNDLRNFKGPEFQRLVRCLQHVLLFYSGFKSACSCLSAELIAPMKYWFDTILERWSAVK
ncbi:uncharacterized protein F4822DRAFT_403002 [Hypoxylon trugodes]|uniref:uncharacterized protein n=1 Tax=Hypoxylon trugodes TaxID=326681 RepID=UPI0021A05953|nr:uncharacterized protein F4822DRAFT_403002 [Hypoxylon trugodes]KAI1388506.1 hypothetical protein F4822DRAFT_403002 [Hypoxylon trugodes]